MVAAINKPVKKVDYTSYYAGAAVFMLLFALTLYFVLNRETPSSTEPSPSETNKLPTKSLTPLTETNKLATKSLTSLTETVNELVSYTPNLDQVIETGVQNSNIKGISKNEYKYMRNKVLKESKRLYPCKKMGGCTPPAFEELLKEKQLMDNNDIYGIPRWCSQDIDCKGFHPNSMCEQNMCSLNGENSQSVDQNLSL